MNQRIRELADDTWEYVCHNDAPKGVLKRDWYDQKFAELIIKECARKVEQELDTFDIDGTFLLKHFGVDE